MPLIYTIKTVTYNHYSRFPIGASYQMLEKKTLKNQ